MLRYLKQEEVYLSVAEKIISYLRKRGITFFKARQIFPLFKNELPNQHINDLCRVLMILQEKGIIEKWSNRTWRVIKS